MSQTTASQKKLYCPLCGRCIGEDESEETTDVKVLLKRLRNTKTKIYTIHSQNCVRCGKRLYITTEQDRVEQVASL